MLLFLSLFLVCGYKPQGAAAQDYNRNIEIEKHFRESGYSFRLYEYKKTLIRAREYENGVRKGVFPIYTLVSAYMGTDNYDPFAQDTIDKLYELAYIADTSKDDAAVRDAAIKDFKALLDLHMANLTVVEKMIPLVQSTPALGDVKFLRWMYQQLTRRLMNSGSGLDMAGAYQIATMGEESYILAQKKVKLLKTEVLNNGTRYYHIHLVENTENGDVERVYMMLTSIMNRYAEIQKTKNPYYTYPLVVPQDMTKDR